VQTNRRYERWERKERLTDEKSQTSIETKNKQVSASSSKHKFAFEIPDGINY
jgi:hypothetical protein